MYNRDVFNYKIFKNLSVVGDYNSPIIRTSNLKPKKIIPFNCANTCKNPSEYYIHFYIHDYQFERIWNDVERYTKMFQKFAGVIGPDFSAYEDLSISHRIYNIYRNKVLTAYWQKNNINVIPNARWIENDRLYNLNHGLDGIPKNSTIAITTHNCFNKKGSLIFRREFNDILKILEPKRIICVGKMPEEQKLQCVESGIELIEFNSYLEEMKERTDKHGKS